MMETSGQALGRGLETRAQRVTRLACGIWRPQNSRVRGLETRAQRDHRLASKYGATTKLARRVGIGSTAIGLDG
jgi:hypothetical protein